MICHIRRKIKTVPRMVFSLEYIRKYSSLNKVFQKVQEHSLLRQECFLTLKFTDFNPLHPDVAYLYSLNTSKNL